MSSDFKLSLESLSSGADVLPTKKKELELQEIQVLSYLEFFWWKNKEIPSFEVIAKNLGLPTQTVAKIFAGPEFLRAVTKAGLPVGKLKTAALTSEQLQVVNVLVSVHDNLSMRQKLKSLGITLRQYQNWLRDPAFQTYLRERMEFNFKNSDVEVKGSLVKTAIMGDVPAMKLYLEMIGEYNPRLQIDVNVTTVVYKMIEIITKHVDDPKVISAIAEDLDELVTDTKRLGTGGR